MTNPTTEPMQVETAAHKRTRLRNYDKFDSFIVSIAKCFSQGKDNSIVFDGSGKAKADESKAFGLTREAVRNLDSMLKSVLERFIDECMTLTRIANSKTVGVRELKTTVKLFMRKDLAMETLDKIDKTIATYTQAQTKNHTQRAGLHIPVRRVANMIRTQCANTLSLAKLAPVVASCILEHLCTSVLSEACRVAILMKRQRITPQHLLLGLSQDDDVRQLFLGTGGFIGHHAGVVPYIAPELLKKKQQRAAVVEATA